MEKMKLFLFTMGMAQGHGRIHEPPGRSSLHRFTADNSIDQSVVNNYPKNYDDTGLFCGGFSTQVQNGYKCGVCGDNYKSSRPRDNELGGKYGKTGIIPRSYDEGATMDVKIELTAHHKGWFSFKICDLEGAETEDEQCFAAEDSIVQFENGETRWDVTEKSNNGFYINRIQLPDDLSCDHCVLQWRYHTGNSWGCDEDECGIGLGQQEEFYGCSDIKIKPRTGPRPTRSTTKALSSTTNVKTTTKSETSATTKSETQSTSKSITKTTSIPQTSAIVDDVDKFCDSRENGHYSHPDDCGKFIQCSNHVTFINHCPNGLYFNAEGVYCDWPENVKCL